MTVEVINTILDYNFNKREKAKPKRSKKDGKKKTILVFDEAGIGHFDEY